MARDVTAERSEIDATIHGKTALTNFEAACSAAHDLEAHRWKDSSGTWHSRTWSEYRKEVRKATAGLKAIGFRPGEFALIMTRNRPGHLIADLAAMHARGTAVSVYNTLAPEQIEYIANHCEATVAILEDAGFLAKFQSIRDRLIDMRHVVVIETAGVTLDDWVTSWDALLARGAEEDERDPAAFEEWRKVTPDDLATLIYTSGTTGPPKGVMQSHRNLCWMAESIDRYLEGRAFQSRHLSYLPFAHTFERFVGHHNAIRQQMMVGFCPDPTQLVAYAVEIRPTALIGVPRVWEKLQAGVMAAIQSDPEPERRAAVLQAIEVGRKLVRLQQAGQEPPSELLEAADRARPVWMALRTKLGLDELDYGITGAAPINPEIIEFFQALGIKLWEGWGMTECTVGASYNPYDRTRNGTVGIADPGVEVKLAEDGEIMVRGGNVMKGYYKDPDKTAETIDPDGWLHTGDIGEMDADGYLKIIDRKKELIITASGKNISPANLEALLMNSPLVGQAAVIGDRRPYLTALIVLDPDYTPVWARKNGIVFSSMAELVEHPAVRAEVQKAIDECNRHVSRAEGIKRFTILPGQWTPETQEVTPALKLKRRVVSQKYAEVIDDMYARVEPRTPVA
ncbi:MAG TPA: AMP-binding protein [Candidatus Dormibacteraeota bacterium]|nr:AMP-binding protein [Candidatus Dormibacteraeota bacterium]